MSLSVPQNTDGSRSTLGAVGWVAIAAGVLLLGLLIGHSLTAEHHEVVAHHEAPPLWGLGILPFIVVLGAIAVLPILPWTHHWWESNLNRLGLSLICSTATVGYVLLTASPQAVITTLEHAIVIEYIPFIVLLFSLYVISGGINLSGDLPAKPETNLAFLAVGAGIASFIGTTGASMLLIRPLLQTNRERKHVVHTVVFFIFLVSNMGGCLLPIGDPPLFLGYLQGVPFFWTMGLWAEWLVACGMALAIYYVVDRRAYAREDLANIQRDELQRAPLRLTGGINLLLLGGVVAAVAFINDSRPLPGTNWTPFPFLRELVMLALVGASLLLTSRRIREANSFNYTAILEVAALFIGIFIAMQVPLEVLRAYGPDLTTNVVTDPWQYFWATGGLSAFLDNAPTYIVFFTLAGQSAAESGPMVELAGGGTVDAAMLAAVSLGAVFMGALTYIGNGPNFMVKSIAEQSGVAMPSFFGYMFKYSLPILAPIFVVITLLFLL